MTNCKVIKYGENNMGIRGWFLEYFCDWKGYVTLEGRSGMAGYDTLEDALAWAKVYNMNVTAIEEH